MTTDEKILEAATDWLLMIEEDASVLTSDAFEGWLHSSPAHLQAFADVSDTWEDVVPERLGVTAHELVLRRKISTLFHLPAIKTAGFAIATCVALLCMVVAYPHLVPPRAEPQFYQAGIGEIRTIELADASTLYVDTDTSAEVIQSAESRLVTLDHGRVFVKVNSADPRVFKVTAGRMAFTATGTAYAVRILDAGYRLDVYEGTVEIRRDGRLLGAVRAGEGARVSGFTVNRFAVPTTPGMPRPEWTNNRIVFTATPLAEAVAEFNRYSRREIVLGSHHLGNEPVSGTFALNDVEAFLQAVTVIVDAPLHETGGTVTIGK